LAGRHVEQAVGGHPVGALKPAGHEVEGAAGPGMHGIVVADAVGHIGNEQVVNSIDFMVIRHLQTMAKTEAETALKIQSPS